MTAPSLIYPCPTHHVTCGFYCYPFHYADDLGAVFEPCWAAADGRIKTVVNTVAGREGRYIEIVHADGWVTRYFHLSRIDVAVGQQVVQGQQIGVTGNSGFISPGVPYAPHLHFAFWAPTKPEALTVWETPQPVAGGMWAVSGIWVIEHQEDFLMALTRDEQLEVLDNARFWAWRAPSDWPLKWPRPGETRRDAVMRAMGELASDADGTLFPTLKRIEDK